jgi:HK97 family phage portal protein
MAVLQSAGALVGLNRPAWGWSSPPAAGITTYAGRTLTYAELYRRQPNVRLVTRFLGRNIAQLGLHAYRRVSDTERRRLPGDHALTELIREPNTATTRHRLIRGVVEDLAVFDDAYLLKVRNQQDPTRLGLFRLPPQWVEPIGSSWFRADAYRVAAAGGRPPAIFAADEVVHLHGHNLDDPRQGCSPLEALRLILAEEAAAGEWRQQFWTGAARMSGVIERPAGARWSDTARTRFSDGWAAAFAAGGGREGETPILEDGMTYRPAAFSPAEAEYLGARKLSREEVASQYGIPPAFVGILENTNFANMDEQHVALYADTFGPWLDLITEDLELQLLPDVPDTADVYLEFNLEEKLRGSFEKRASAASTAVGAPWMTRNEMRARDNLPGLDGGDELVTPLNVLVGGLASPRDTAPIEPATGPDNGAAARRFKAARPAAVAARAALAQWERAHADILASHFRRQGSVVLAGLGAERSVTDAYAGADPDRWTRELATDLLRVAVAANAELGALAAERFGSTYDPDRALGWLTVNARIAAEKIEATTLGQVTEAVTGLKARTKAAAIDDDDPDIDPDDEEHDPDLDAGPGEPAPSPLDRARAVFALAVTVRAVQLAATRSTAVGNFSLADGAGQAGARSKVWVVTATNSRHPEMDGETVPLGTEFSNGGAWPGDPALGADETAGCTCVLDFTTD